jgi:RNA polymerase sigma factor (sigma-70 family)
MRKINESGCPENKFAVFSKKLAKRPGPGVCRYEGEKTASRGWKEVNSMELSSSRQETIQKQFERYCKSILRNAKKNRMRDMRRLAEHEIAFPDLSEREMTGLYATDDYATDYIHFEAGGHDVPIKNDLLADALTKLPRQTRDIVLLAHCLGMKDAEIAALLDMARSTVQYRRTSSLEKLKKMMTEEADDEKS